MVTSASDPGWEQGWCLPASSNHGAQGRCEMHEGILLLFCYRTWYRECNESCPTRARHCDDQWVMPSHGKCWASTQEPTNAVCTELLSVHLGIWICNTSTLSILYLITWECSAAPLLKLNFPPGGFSTGRKGTRMFCPLTHDGYLGHFMSFSPLHTPVSS